MMATKRADTALITSIPTDHLRDTFMFGLLVGSMSQRRTKVSERRFFFSHISTMTMKQDLSCSLSIPYSDLTKTGKSVMYLRCRSAMAAMTHANKIIEGLKVSIFKYLRNVSYNLNVYRLIKVDIQKNKCENRIVFSIVHFPLGTNVCHTTPI